MPLPYDSPKGAVVVDVDVEWVDVVAMNVDGCG